MLPVLLFLACVIGAVAFGVNPYYYKHWCNNPCCPLPLTYDTHCAKMFPSYPSRDFKCASSWTPDRLVGFAPDAPLSALAVNSTFFDDVPGADLIDIAAVIVRRDASGAAWFKYVGNRFYGRSSETWSSSKVFVAAFAASALRSHCSMGLDSHVIDAESCYAVGDLLTVIATYDSTLGFSSNSLAGNTISLPDPHLQLASLNPPPPLFPSYTQRTWARLQAAPPCLLQSRGRGFRIQTHQTTSEEGVTRFCSRFSCCRHHVTAGTVKIPPLLGTPSTLRVPPVACSRRRSVRPTR